MPCNKYFHELPRLESVTARIGNAMITYQELTHPDSVFAYAIEAGGKKFVCATDTEHKSIADPRLVKLAKDADILYYDAQYLPEEYAGGKKGLVTGALPKLDWGHSTYQWAVINALEAGVGTVVLGHHDPLRDDSGIEEIVSRAQGFLNVQLLLPQNKWKHLDVVAAYEGLEQEL